MGAKVERHVLGVAFFREDRKFILDSEDERVFIRELYATQSAVLEPIRKIFQIVLVEQSQLGYFEATSHDMERRHI